MSHRNTHTHRRPSRLRCLVAVGAALPCLIALTAGLDPSTAQAQPVEVKKKPVDVDAAFAKAQEDFQAGRYQEALTNLEAIYATEPDPVILYNIARCHQELQHWDDAETTFVKALGDEKLPDELRQQGTGHLETVRAEKARLAQAQNTPKEDPPKEDPPKEDPPTSLATAFVGGHVGVLVPQPFNELGSWPIFGVEAGYVLPFDLGPFTRPLVVTLDVLYSSPGAEGSGSDPNLGDDGGDYSWELQEQMLIFELTASWRFMPLGEFLSVYAQIGPRLYLLESVLNAKASEGGDFGENRETDTNTGLVVATGLDLQLGPGTAFGALEFAWSGLDQRITGDTNTGALSLDLGYRLHF